MTPEKARQHLWYRGNLSWKLRDYQVPIHAALRALPKSVREAVALLTRRFGKSVLGEVMALEDCIQNPGEQIFVIGPNLIQTTKIITPILNMLCADAPRGLVRPTKSERRWKVGRSDLMIAAFDTAIESVRGLDAFSMYLEESGLAKPEDYDYTMLSVLNHTLQRSRGRKVHLTTPAKELDHPLHTKTLPAAELNNALFIRTIEDNTSLTPEEIAEEIKNAGGRGSVHCERELFCKIMKDPTSTVVPEFEENFIKEMTPPPFAHWQAVTDYGGVLDPHHSLLNFYDFERAKFCVYDERWLPKNTDTAEVVKQNLEMEKQAKWLTEEARRISDCPGQVLVDLRKMGYRTFNPDKEKGSWEAMINAIRIGFQQDKIEIHPRCVKLIAQLKYGQYTTNRKDFQRSEALGHLDGIAALGYGYKHKVTDNPFPRYLGKSKYTHFIDPKDLENKSALDQAFTPNFKG